MTLVRRKVLAFLVVCSFAIMVLGARSAQTEVSGAGELLEAMTHDVFAILENSSLSPGDKERELLEVFRQNFDVPTISRFVLGKNWRNASEAERRDFIDAFEEMNARKFLEMVGDFSEDLFSIGSVKQDDRKPSLFLVNTEVGQSQGEPIAVVWRVRNKDGQFKVIDVIIEGVSMAITLRHEYGTVIKTNGVDGLIAMMREKHTEITQQ